MKTLAGLSSLLTISLALMSTAASAHRPLPGEAGHYGPVLAPYRKAPPTSGTWRSLTNQFPGNQPDTALLMTDGTVMMHDFCASNWYRLTPDVTESYVNGTWNEMHAMASSYTPAYFASAVLPDGRLIVNGGEYNGSSCGAVWTTAGALYDPVANSWTSVSAPSGWSSIGDAASVVLQNGTYLLQNCCSTQDALASISGTTVTWTITGSGKSDSNDEEGWTLLPSGEVLTVDTNSDLGQDSPSEIYFDTTGSWYKTTGAAKNVLVDPVAQEIGPAVLRPNGAVFQIGANSCGAAGCKGYTGIYDEAEGTWSAGPTFPKISGSYYDTADGPAAILPDGNVLVQASPSYSCLYKGKPSPYCSPSHFFEYNGSKLIRVNEPADAPKVASYEGRMLVLPSGNILWSHILGGANGVEVYSPSGHVNSSWLPTLSSLSTTTLVRGTTGYSATGTQFQGVSDGAAYGDDAQMATNFPLVRIQSIASGHYCFARTHAFGATQTKFDMPPVTPPVWQLPCEAGFSKLQIVVQGLLSKPMTVSVL